LSFILRLIVKPDLLKNANEILEQKLQITICHMMFYIRGGQTFLMAAKFENYFSSWAALLEIIDFKVTISAKQKKWSFWCFYWQFLTKFFITEKGPRAAKISWRATLWPCLFYIVELLLKYFTLAYILCKTWL